MKYTVRKDGSVKVTEVINADRQILAKWILKKEEGPFWDFVTDLIHHREGVLPKIGMAIDYGPTPITVWLHAWGWHQLADEITEKWYNL